VIAASRPTHRLTKKKHRTMKQIQIRNHASASANHAQTAHQKTKQKTLKSLLI
jgi:hypothetical protein